MGFLFLGSRARAQPERALKAAVAGCLGTHGMFDAMKELAARGDIDPLVRIVGDHAPQGAAGEHPDDGPGANLFPRETSLPD
jgi:hypothetical protein